MRTLSLLMVLLGGVACGGEEVGGGPSTDTDTDVGPPAPELLTVHGWHLTFAWDDALGQTRSTFWLDEERPSTLRLLLGTSSYLGPDSSPDASCSLSWDVDGTPETDLDGADTPLLGLRLTLSEDRLMADDCTERIGTTFDPLGFVDGPAADLSGWTLDFALGGPIGDDIPAAMFQELPDPSNAFGGTLDLAYLPEDSASTGPSDILVYPYEINEGFGVLTENGQPYPVDPATVQTETSLTSGYYEINAEYLWRVRQQLLTRKSGGPPPPTTESVSPVPPAARAGTRR